MQGGASKLTIPCRAALWRTAACGPVPCAAVLGSGLVCEQSSGKVPVGIGSRDTRLGWWRPDTCHQADWSAMPIRTAECQAIRTPRASTSPKVKVALHGMTQCSTRGAGVVATASRVLAATVQRRGRIAVNDLNAELDPGLDSQLHPGKVLATCRTARRSCTNLLDANWALHVSCSSPCLATPLRRSQTRPRMRSGGVTRHGAA